MVFKRFKDQSNRKCITKLIESRQISDTNEVVKTIGVILRTDEFNDVDAIKLLLTSLNVQSNQIRIITFSPNQKPNELNSWDDVFTAKDLGWKGKINNVELERFLDTNFDVLIGFYNQSNLELNLVTALSKAKFKIGVCDDDLQLNDLIINVNTQETEIFKTELIKYLKVLNKL